ncbi:MAG: tRNA (adenosine(37)-N6)-threonylcarbamoyltransferase complex dimerization subunit type 1 TsaB [Pyrinomonadaceae bacterium]|nr:tRNA (adenosine(37)-N6)-threonylcarbamoyltransferase complex dimerization subunit type 1 TsaB [Pyrinomonadaceae bacterium]
MNRSNVKYLLAVESAVGGGSIALFAIGQQIEGVVGPAGVSRAEDLLPNIELLLSRNNIDKLDLSHIAVSAGPGSFTGIRIGIATVMGLAAALNVDLRQYSMLEAIAVSTQIMGTFTVVLPVGRDTVCAQTFERTDSGLANCDEPHPLTPEEFHSVLQAGKTAVVNSSLFEQLPDELRSGVTNVGDDLAAILGNVALTYNLDETPEPLFVGKRK